MAFSRTLPVFTLCMVILVQAWLVNAEDVCALDNSGREISRPLDKESLRLLDLAKVSPTLVGKHDKTGWLQLFDPEGIIEDPVGAPVHKDFSRFYETFIAPNDIVFDLNYEWVDKARKLVYRAVDIHITFPSGGIQVQPVVIRYEYNKNDKLNSLRAFWQMTKGYPLAKTAVLDHLKYAAGATVAFVKVFNNFGLSWGLQYVKGLGAGLFSGGESCVRKFFDAYNKNNFQAIEALQDKQDILVTMPYSETSQGITAAAEKLANELLVLSFTVDRVYNSGYHSAAFFDVRVGKETEIETFHGLAIFEISDSSSLAKSIEIFW